MNTIGWIGSALLAFCGLPELFRTVYNGKCSVGWGMLLMWLFGEILVLIYVLPKFDLPLIANYMTNLSIVSVMIFYKINGDKI